MPKKKLILYFLLLIAPAFSQEEKREKDLRATFDNLIRVSKLNPKKIGIVIYSLDRKEFLFTHNKEKSFIPASNQKLLLSACGLSFWNENFKEILTKKMKRKRALRKKYLFTCLNSKSDNLLAEACFKAIGAYKRDSPARVIRNYLAKNKIPTTGLVIADGSGRSRKNRATPLTFVRLLTFLYFSPYKKDFLGSLAVAGRRGTLKKRLPSLSGMVYAKTGYIRQVNALSGYLFSPKGNYSFSIIINDKVKDFSNWEFMERYLSSLL